MVLRLPLSRPPSATLSSATVVGTGGAGSIIHGASAAPFSAAICHSVLGNRGGDRGGREPVSSAHPKHTTSHRAG